MHTYRIMTSTYICSLATCAALPKAVVFPIIAADQLPRNPIVVPVPVDLATYNLHRGIECELRA